MWGPRHQVRWLGSAASVFTHGAITLAQDGPYLVTAPVGSEVIWKRVGIHVRAAEAQG